MMSLAKPEPRIRRIGQSDGSRGIGARFVTPCPLETRHGFSQILQVRVP